MGIEKYPIPANISTTVSSSPSSLILFFSARYPCENIIRMVSSLKKQPFSLRIVSVLLPAMISRRGSLFWPLIPLSRSTVLHLGSVSYTHLRAHETRHDLVC